MPTALAANVAALASLLGGGALRRASLRLFASIAQGFTAGVMLATVAFAMLPEARNLAPIALVAVGIGGGLRRLRLGDLRPSRRPRRPGRHPARAR